MSTCHCSAECKNDVFPNCTQLMFNCYMCWNLIELY
jgi:hypothetical protein